MSSFLYVDDITLFDKVAVNKATRHLSTSAPRAHFDELELQHDFSELDSRARGINMKNGYTHSASLRVGEGDVIASVDKN